MVFDGLRNSAYVRAMEKLVRPGSTVMDLGAGLGVLGFHAAALGAARVHLVEPTIALDAAREVAADNELANLVFHQARVEELQLAEQVDVIISVFTGNFLLEEDLLPSLFYARDRFLAPGGGMIPDRAQMEAVPVSAPEYYRKYVEVWDSYPAHARLHGIPQLDFGAIRRFAGNTILYDARDSISAEPLASPVALMELDFMTASSAACDSHVTIEFNRDGSCHGLLGWFRMRLGHEWLSTSAEHDATHWSLAFMPLPEPIQVKAGEHLDFSLKRPETGEWTWTTVHGGIQQRQSTFMSQPQTRARLRKLSGAYQPTLSPRGQAVGWLLGNMNGETSVEQLAQALFSRQASVFHSEAEALALVKELVGRYGQGAG